MHKVELQVAETNGRSLFANFCLYQVNSISLILLNLNRVINLLMCEPCYREHIPHASPFGDDLDDNILSCDTEMTLLFGELHTDKWLNNKPDIIPTST